MQAAVEKLQAEISGSNNNQYSQMNTVALQMIENSLGRLIQKGCPIMRLKLVVCPYAEISKYKSIRTKYGNLRVEPDLFVRKGLSYIIEEPGRRNRGFAWVSGYNLWKEKMS
ncbi:hypothetical protein MUG84_26605 [Paenibacillus sp. KQZ6P-2]|uniref:Uncharacterized protein n=1 Tax=Paenibacillus mangrovi TaxID=2931978 RepID=A0A9X1WZT8_9BACL|nr:hypothetical protein [Paenibacillus mangrovi]MCJ8015244.1 hypothetical protein [Paenibacillus mangrovi]